MLHCGHKLASNCACQPFRLSRLSTVDLYIREAWKPTINPAAEGRWFITSHYFYNFHIVTVKSSHDFHFNE